METITIAEIENAFEAINKEEYLCAKAEMQCDENLFKQVNKEYKIAKNAFIQGALWMSHEKNNSNSNRISQI